VLNRILFLCCFVSLLHRIDAGMMDQPYSFYGSPLLLLNNPSLLSEQSGMPFGIRYSFADTSSEKIGTGMLVPFDNRAFSVVYEKDSSLHHLATGFTHRYREYTMGTAFNLLFERTAPGLAIDVASSYLFPSKQTVSCIVHNVLHTNCPDTHIAPSFSVQSSGPLFSLVYPFLYHAAVGLITEEKVRSLARVSSKVVLSSYLFKNPSFHYSFGVRYSNVLGSTQEYTMLVSGGTLFSLGASGIGCFFECESSPTGKFGDVSVGFYWNPLENHDVSPPFVEISVENDRSVGVYIGINSNDDGGSGIKEWFICITSKPTSDATVLKMYAGKHQPPSTIYWDFRDSNGILHRNETVYLQCVVLDKRNNSAKTPWYPINAHQRNLENR
jgi:hypothetical protein